MGDAEEYLNVTVEYFLSMEIIPCKGSNTYYITSRSPHNAVGHPTMLVVEEGYNNEQYYMYS